VASALCCLAGLVAKILVALATLASSIAEIADTADGADDVVAAVARAPPTAEQARMPAKPHSVTAPKASKRTTTTTAAIVAMLAGRSCSAAAELVGCASSAFAAAPLPKASHGANDKAREWSVLEVQTPLGGCCWNGELPFLGELLSPFAANCPAPSSHHGAAWPSIWPSHPPHQLAWASIWPSHSPHQLPHLQPSVGRLGPQNWRKVQLEQTPAASRYCCDSEGQARSTCHPCRCTFARAHQIRRSDRRHTSPRYPSRLAEG